MKYCPRQVHLSKILGMGKTGLILCLLVDDIFYSPVLFDELVSARGTNILNAAGKIGTEEDGKVDICVLCEVQGGSNVTSVN